MPLGEHSVTELRAIMAASPVAIVSSTATGEISSWNPAAEQLFGWSADDVLGRPLPFLLAEARAAHADRCDAVLRGHRVAGLELEVATRTGARIPIAAAMAPIL